MYRQIRIVIFFILFISVKAYSAGITEVGRISESYINQGWTMVRVAGVASNPDGCGSTDYYALDPVQPNYNSLNAALLAAQMAGKRVKFWVNGCGGQSNMYPHIESVFTLTE